MEEKRPVEDILKETAQMLGNIHVPVALIDSVAIPVARAVANINACVAAFDAARKDENQVAP